MNHEPYDPNSSVDCFGRDIEATKYPVGTPTKRSVLHVGASGELVSFKVGNDTYHVNDDVTLDIPQYLQDEQELLVVSLKRLNKERVKNELKLFTLQREARDAMQGLVDQYTGAEFTPKDHRLACYLRKIQCTALRAATQMVELLATQIAVSCEVFLLNVTYWYGVTLPLEIETLTDAPDNFGAVSEFAKQPEIIGVRIRVADLPMTQDGERRRSEMLVPDCRFMFPQQWQSISKSSRHMGEATEKVMGPTMYAKFKQQKTGIIQPPGGGGIIVP